MPDAPGRRASHGSGTSAGVTSGNRNRSEPRAVSGRRSTRSQPAEEGEEADDVDAQEDDEDAQGEEEDFGKRAAVSLVFSRVIIDCGSRVPP